uniref:Uncharacterized protein n=1 Tax=Parascaris equorum TaxID=6256 RepID=A0A914R8C8_PAREQ
MVSEQLCLQIPGLIGDTVFAFIKNVKTHLSSTGFGICCGATTTGRLLGGLLFLYLEAPAEWLLTEQLKRAFCSFFW